MLDILFQQQKELINNFYDAIDLNQCNKIFEKILHCQGVSFFTGIGKSGYIAQKIAATMMSTGTKSFFLSPIDALHGDLGMVSEKDIVIIFSKSGDTDELLHLLPPLRNKGIEIICITSHSHSRLAKGCDLACVLPCERELCPYDLAPTISTEIQLLFGDVLAVALMKAKGISIEQYANNHPAGNLGKKMTLKVKDLMLPEEKTPVCFEEDQLVEVISSFSEKRCGCLIVIDDQKRLKGIFTDGDLRRALQAKGDKVLREAIGKLMTKTPKVIAADSLAWEAMKLMESDQKNPVMVLPVVHPEDKVIGIIKMHDIIQAGL